VRLRASGVDEVATSVSAAVERLRQLAGPLAAVVDSSKSAA
jgi:hypothetical protein